MDQTGYAVIAFGMSVVLGVCTYLAATMHPRGPRRWTVLALAFTWICIAVQVLAILAHWQVLGQVVTFVVVLAALLAVAGATVHRLRTRPRPTLRRTGSGHLHWVNPDASKSYASDVRAARRQARQQRQAARA